MKQRLTIDERQRLDRKVAEFERLTGCQIVLALVERSDSYAELPWKAFALGSGIAGLVVTVVDLTLSAWHSSALVLVSVVITLLCGAACALACVGVSSIARLFLDRLRAEAESRQYAESLFLSREVFGTKDRTGILLMISLFEHQVAVLPDTGITGRLSKDVLGKIIASMAAPLQAGRIAVAFEMGLEGITEAVGTSTGAAPTNELANDIIQEKGS